MRKFRQWMISFMYGRNGMDSLNLFLFGVYFVMMITLWIVTLFGNAIIYTVISVLMMIVSIFMIFRLLSKNLYKRQNENRKFLSIKASVKSYINLQKAKIKDRNTHIYKKCPNCKAVLRLKKIKGKHRASCPKCLNSFDITVR